MMLIGVGEQTKASGLLKFSTLMSCLNSSQLMIKMDADTLNARANLFASLNPLVENICVRDGNMRLCKFRRAFCGRPVRSSSYYLSYVFIRKEDLALQDSLLLSTVSKTIPTSVLNFLPNEPRIFFTVSEETDQNCSVAIVDKLPIDTAPAFIYSMRHSKGNVYEKINKSTIQ